MNRSYRSGGYSGLVSLLFKGMLFAPLAIWAGDLSGTVVDAQSKALPNVQLLVHGSQTGTTTDSLGNFAFSNIPAGRHLLYISHIGYADQRITVLIPRETPLTITLDQTILQLSEVTIQGTAVTDVRTPVTHSSLTAEAIDAARGVRDVPQLLNQEPGVYVTNDGGAGFGDSHIMIRGFDEKRLQILVNNIPVNDPETKEIAWSSWSALSDATQAVQVQRGVGTALYGTGAIGGAINIVTLDASQQRSTRARFTLGQFGVKKISLSHDTGLGSGQRSLFVNLGYLEGSGWRDNSFYRGLQYYLALTQRMGTTHLFKFIFHGSPQYHTLAMASLSAASYARPDQFAHDSLRFDGWGNPAYGFGASFNGNVHVAEANLSESDRETQTSLLDALFLRSKIGASPANQVGGYTLAGDRASMNSNVSHRPQFELHHNWYLNPTSKLTTTAFYTRGLDYSDDVYPAWYIPRQSNGLYSYEQINTRNYWFSEEVFEYRYYSDFSQLGILSAFSTKNKGHAFSVGFESRLWTSRHAGEVLDSFGQDQVGVPIGGVVHPLEESDLFYDFTTSKPQATLFGHALWQFGRVQLMTNLQFSRIRFQVQEQIPSNNNYPVYQDSLAPTTHGGEIWVGTATWDDDNDSLTAEIPVEYSLWDYSKSFQYLTPRLGLSYRLTPQFNLYANYSMGIKEPEIKHFYGYGAPRDDLELERTRDLELGLRYVSTMPGTPFRMGLTYYNIDFAGKLMQITLPEKANTPGYDYAGHTYVPVGDARYSGLEFSGKIQLPHGFAYETSASWSKNVWGEPKGFEGAQKLYGNQALAGTDYDDVNGNGIWEEGGQEQALHRNFVSKYGHRYDVGMPQMIWNNSLALVWSDFSGRISLRYFKDLYVLENNAEILVGPGKDDLYFTTDDEVSATLPAALITDAQAMLVRTVGNHTIQLSLQVQNLLDVPYWQRGDEFGLLPGGARTWLTRLEFKL